MGMSNSRKRQLKEARKKSMASRKAKAAAKKLKLEAGIEVEPIEDSFDQPSDFNLPFMTEVKTEYIDEDLSLDVHIAPI